MSDFLVLAEDYLGGRSVCAKHAASVRALASRCQHLSTNFVNRYLKSRLETRSTVTVANERRVILTVWRWAWETGRIEDPPRGIMRVQQRPKPIRAWTMGDLSLIARRTSGYSGKRMRCGADRGDFLHCWIMLGYETGARWGDLWAMRRDDLQGNVIRWQTNKTGECQHRPLTDTCMASVNAMLSRSPDGRILGWVCNKRYAMRLMKEHLLSCGLEGSSKWLRRSGATHVEQYNPGKAKVFLGHRSPGMADRHYIDHSQIRRNDIVVPSLMRSG